MGSAPHGSAIELLLMGERRLLLMGDEARWVGCTLKPKINHLSLKLMDVSCSVGRCCDAMRTWSSSAGRRCAKVPAVPAHMSLGRSTVHMFILDHSDQAVGSGVKAARGYS